MNINSAINEAFNIDYFETRKKKLTESVDIPARLDQLMDVAGDDPYEILDALIRWLPYETLEKFAEDIAADWDLDAELE